MANNQEQSQTPATEENPQAQANETSTGVPPELQKFADTPSSNEQATAQQAQAQDQAQNQPGQPDGIAELQRKLNERTVRAYQLEQELERVRQEQIALAQARAPQQANQNPHDPNANWTEWLRWELDQRDERIASKSEERFMNRLQSLAQQQAEIQWQQSHPDVDIQTIKAYARANGIADWNLELAYRDMVRGNTLQQVAQQTAQQAINQFRQPQPGAQPLRGTGSAGPQTVGLRFEKMLDEFTKNPSIYETWPPQLQKMFDQELYYRKANGSQ